MLLPIAFALLMLWVIGFVVFKVAAAIIHLLVLLAVVALVLHFVRRGKAASTRV